MRDAYDLNGMARGVHSLFLRGHEMGGSSCDTHQPKKH